MRWERLFDDLEAQLDVLARAELAAEVAEHTRSERGNVALADRLLGHLGGQARLRVRGLGWIEARLLDLGADWLLAEVVAQGRESGRQLLVPTAAIIGVWDLPALAVADQTAASRRFGLRHALRGISRDRAVVRVHDIDGDHATGTIERVLADHLDLLRHADDAVPRGGQVRGRLTLPFGALAAVRRL